MRRLGHRILRGALALARREEGATAVEYGLLISLIATALVLGLTPLGKAITANFTLLASHLDGAFS